MKTLDQFYEDARAKIRGMSDSQFADYKRANPGAAAKADELRKEKPSTTTTSSAIVKREPKTLPGSKGGSITRTTNTEPGALAKTPADKGAALVRTKQSKTVSAPASGSDEKQAGMRPGTPKKTPVTTPKGKPTTSAKPKSRRRIKIPSIKKVRTTQVPNELAPIQGSQEIRRGERR